MKETCDIGIIGAGGVAARHADVLSGFGDARIAAVADPDGERAAALAGRHGARAYRDHVAMLESEALDAVYVCVPPFAHGPPEHAVIEAGLPMFVEKPIAIDLAVAEEIARRVAAAGTLTAVGHQWRYLRVAERARELMAGREVRMLLGHWLDKVPPVAWWSRLDGSGGQVVEQAAHVIDLARLLAGEVAEVHALESRTRAGGAPDSDVAAATIANLEFQNGAVGNLAATCLLAWKHRAGLEVYAEGLAMELSESWLRVHTGAAPDVVEDEGLAKTRIDRAFVDAVRGLDDDVRTDYADALRTHRVACAIARSAVTGRRVAVEEGALW
ncbi:Gfo/Idh/MocA family protein [Marinactinospora thermotolerans]|uniref:Predicted dehydrogenase n=1 Tax=Marinactinospora thermotolerans DSM 45154 TaxID=1122192 RepID=A0A1T4NDP0_9ACTN|nr:Gfo/Idh/MocA family oxidoreductase [Marinactinospora thermotolerans]SJZ77107.1 Predicted dehydrogenase [Marinactinospora thermotolerans DSM 45154]